MNPAALTMIPLDVDKELSSFDDYLKLGTDEEERPKGDRSRFAYCWTIKLFLKFCGACVPSPDLAKDFIKRLGTTNQPTSINRHIWSLKSYFRFKGGERLKIRGLQADKHLPRYLLDDEWERLVLVANRPFKDKNLPESARQRARLELALLYAYCSGPRASEIINMKLEDIDNKGFIRILRKGGTQAWVPVETVVIKALREYIASRPGNGPYVFPGKTPGSHMAVRRAQYIVKTVCVRAGFSDVHIHTLRHTAGYQLRKLGSPERDIQDVLGHKSLATTQIYTHLVREDLQRRLPKRFSNANQGKLL